MLGERVRVRARRERVSVACDVAVTVRLQSSAKPDTADDASTVLWDPAVALLREGGYDAATPEREAGLHDGR